MLPNIDESVLREATQRAIQAAREALANDPANRLARQITQATTGNEMGLVLTLTLAEPQTEPATNGEDASTLTASYIRARAEEVGFNLNGRSLRSRADKDAALAEIEAWASRQDEAEEPPVENETPSPVEDEGPENEPSLGSVQEVDIDDLL